MDIGRRSVPERRPVARYRGRGADVTKQLRTRRETSCGTRPARFDSFRPWRNPLPRGAADQRTKATGTRLSSLREARTDLRDSASGSKVGRDWIWEGPQGQEQRESKLVLRLLQSLQRHCAISRALVFRDYDAEGSDAMNRSSERDQATGAGRAIIFIEERELSRGFRNKDGEPRVDAR